MAEHFRFFNSSEGDPREYPASDFAEYFSLSNDDGVHSKNGVPGLKATPGTGLTVNVATGYALMRGYMYHNDAEMALELEPADSVLQRIDRIVVRLDLVAREIRAAVKTGTFSSTPAAPTLEDTTAVKELALAQVKIRAGATAITTQDITDERSIFSGARVFTGRTEPVGIQPGDIWLEEV